MHNMADSTTTVDTTTTTETENTPEVETVTMTKAELDAMLQKEGDKRVAQALKTQEKKQREANKLKNMTDDERHEYELSERERAIEAKERELALADMTNVASKVLIDKGLDIALVELVVDEDSEVTNDRIKKLEKAFKASVKAEVEKRIGNRTPEKPQADPDTITKESFRKMSLREQQELARTNPQLYNELVKN